MTIRVFLTDDHLMLREGLQLLINQQPDMQVVGVAGDGRSALAQLAGVKTDIVVMDVSMPGINGIEATRHVCETWPDMRVVMLTRHSEPCYIRQTLQAGARAYVLKQAPSHELIDAIRTVAAGDVFLDSKLTRYAAEMFVKSQHNGTNTSALDLSERETEVVRLIAHGYSNQEIGARLSVSVKTIETYKARAMHKLGIYNRVALVRFAIEQGWFEPD